MENNQENIKIEIPNITNPILALQLIYQALDHSIKAGTFNMNDSAKIHASLICLVKALKAVEVETTEEN